MPCYNNQVSLLDRQLVPIKLLYVTLQSDGISHWLGANVESVLQLYPNEHEDKGQYSPYATQSDSSVKVSCTVKVSCQFGRFIR